MKTVVLAYHNIGCAGIEALLDHGFDIQAVFTHRDESDEHHWFNSVAEMAAEKGLQVFAPDNINHPLWVERIRELAPDIIFSFYYRTIVGTDILEIPKNGCLNLHGSLLPKYRGRCPVNWALVNGEQETGVTLHYMTPQPDNGDILAQERIAISTKDTAFSLHRKLTTSASKLLDANLPLLLAGNAPRIPQDHSLATYFGSRRPADGEIDWHRSAEQIMNLVRAVTRPYPGAFSYLGNRKVLFWSVSPVAGDADQQPGTVLSGEPLIINCGQGAIEVGAGQVEESGLFVSGDQLARDMCLAKGMHLGRKKALACEQQRKNMFLSWERMVLSEII